MLDMQLYTVVCLTRQILKQKEGGKRKVVAQILLSTLVAAQLFRLSAIAELL